MAVDITELAEEQLLPILGEGDWVIATPEGYPDLVVSAEWRDSVVEWAGTQFIRWVLNGTRCQISYDDDPPWDHSGEVFKEKVNPERLRTLHKTLAKWLDEEYTGDWEATFESGLGKRWHTYDDEFEFYLGDVLSDLIRSACWVETSNVDDESQDELWEDFDLVYPSLQRLLSRWVGHVSTDTVWKRFERFVHYQLGQEREVQSEITARHRRMSEQAQEFWIARFAQIAHLRIEQPQYRTLQLEARLREALADADPDIVKAVAEVGLPGDFSNTVRDAILKIARDIAND